MSLYIEIYNMLSIVVLVIFTYSLILITRRITINKKYDKEFGINTRGLRSWEKGSLYNRTESTPYLALNSLTEEYSMDSKDRLVDFGCGKGRVAIFLHHKYKIPVTGVELNDLTYMEALENVDSYTDKHNANKDLEIIQEYAEGYRIKKDENKFFFFNPFDVSIFEKVVNNIINNAKEHNKEVEIILYYPVGPYKKFLRNETPFELIEKIGAQESIGFREEFLIYKYTP